ncbi:MAG: sugar phosphate nucleotidyltransferase [Thermofilaceae archaeon]
MKAVILAAGLGTRLIPYSKEMPKEMLPIFQLEGGKPILKPILQVVFEQLYEAGVREYCFVVGRGKRAVEDHFTPDWSYVDFLEEKGKFSEAELLRRFYRMIESSHIVWVNQPVPRGTGDAVAQAKHFAADKYFFVAAGDNVFLGENVAKELLRLHKEFGGAVMAGKRVEDPRRYGVIVGRGILERVIKLERIIEKPRDPPNNLVNTSLYLLPPRIFEALETCKPSPRGEIELTDAVQTLVEWGEDFYVYDVGNAYWVDVGTPETYLDAILLSLKVCNNPVIIEEACKMLQL